MRVVFEKQLVQVNRCLNKLRHTVSNIAKSNGNGYSDGEFIIRTQFVSSRDHRAGRPCNNCIKTFMLISRELKVLYANYVKGIVHASSFLLLKKKLY